jgi:hypothetical protein
MLGTQPTPSLVVDVQLLPQTRNVISRASTSDRTVFVPTCVSQICHLIDTAPVVNSAGVKPSLREEMVYFAGSAQAVGGRIE